MQPKENSNMLFNLICDYSLNLSNFVMEVDPERRKHLQSILKNSLEINPRFQLYKESFLTFTSIYVEADPAVLLANLEALHQKLNSPDSDIPCPSYIEIMVKFFKANLFMRQGNIEASVAIASQMIKKDVREYFGHSQADVAIGPRMIILNHKFEKLASAQLN